MNRLALACSIALFIGGEVPGWAAPSQVILAPPDLQGWKPAPQRVEDFPKVVTARHFRAPIYASPRRNSRLLGWARAGTVLPAEHLTDANGCRGGTWYKVPGGYVCTSKGFAVGRQKVHHRALPRRKRLLPYDYVKKTDANARLLLARPSGAQVAEWKQESKWSAPRTKAMPGDYLLAVVAKETIGNASFFRTARGRYLPTAQAQPFVASKLRGERLGTRWKLPLAFVFGKDRPLYAERGGALKKAGVAKKYTRFVVDHGFVADDRKWVANAHGITLPAAQVRVARRIDRPEGIPAQARWIHVDLHQQILVAYRGDRPVYATLISSGKEGYEPPTGRFRIVHKRVSSTMRGSDKQSGSYTVQEVPWTQFYHRAYALHGAYWHDDFGTPKSHGCTNIAPADAYWLFRWTSPRLARGWHIAKGQGTYVVFTDAPPLPEESR